MMPRLRALAVAEPVFPHLHGRGTLLGCWKTAAYVDHEGFVVAVTGHSVPMMPNGISVAAARMPGAAPGGFAYFDGDAVTIGKTTIELSFARAWSPAVRRDAGAGAEAVAGRGRSVLRACGVAAITEPKRLFGSLADAGPLFARDGGGREAVVAALTAVSHGDRSGLAGAAAGLIGRGGGLTPEGDDFAGGMAAALAAFGSVADFSPCLADALVAVELRRRTTALSATLLELATRGLVVEPLIPVADLGAPHEQWRGALRRLISMGHTTGRAWALGFGAVALVLGCARTPRSVAEGAGPQS